MNVNTETGGKYIMNEAIYLIMAITIMVLAIKS